MISINTENPTITFDADFSLTEHVLTLNRVYRPQNLNNEVTSITIAKMYDTTCNAPCVQKNANKKKTSERNNLITLSRTPIFFEIFIVIFKI